MASVTRGAAALAPATCFLPSAETSVHGRSSDRPKLVEPNWRVRASAAHGLQSLNPSLYSRPGLSGVRAPARVVCSVAVTTVHKSKTKLLAEEAYRRAVMAPLEGVPFTETDFMEALDKYDFSFEVGDTVKGVVFKADRSGILVDIGAKAPALLPLPETCIFKIKDVGDTGLFPGMREEFRIIEDEDYDGRLTLSLRRIQYELAWERSRQCLADDVTVLGRVLAINRGGVLVQAEGLRGFVPTSHLAVRTPKEELLGKQIPLKFLEVEEERTRLVLSNRRAAAEVDQLRFSVGDVVLGTVQSIKPYGAFVDIGGSSGLLHISQISHDRVTTVETVLREGDQIKVMVLSQDRDRGRLSLSTKKLEPTPGDMLRNPALVFEKADEMAKLFKERVAAAEALARADEQQYQMGGYKYGLDSLESGPDASSTDLDSLVREITPIA